MQTAHVGAGGRLHAGLGGQRHVGPHTQPHHHEVGGDLPGFGGDGPHPPLTVGLEALDAGAQAEVHPLGDQPVCHPGAHVGVERGHRLVELLHERDLEAPKLERLHHLQADVAAADHHRPTGRPVPDLIVEGHRVGDDVDPAHTLGVDVGERWPDGRGAGGDQEVVVGLAAHGPGLDHAHLHHLLGRVDGHDLVPGAHVDAPAPVLLGRAGHEAIGVPHQTADEVREPARRV